MSTSTVSMVRPKVLIASRIGWWAGTVRLPAMLNEAGAETTVFAPPDSAVMRSRFIHTRIAASANSEKFATALKAHLLAQGDQYAWIVFGDEPSMTAVFESRTASWPGKFFPVDPTESAFDRIMSKAAFVTTAAKFGVPVPKSVVCDSVESARISAAKMGFPFILKTARGVGGDGVAKIKTQFELEAALLKFEQRLPFVVQEVVRGSAGSTQMLLDHGVPVCWMASEKWIRHPSPLGPSCARRLLTHPEMETIVHSVGKLTNFHGLCGVDWMLRPDGSLVVLEFNPRPTPVMHLSKIVGADPAKAIRAMLRGGRDVQKPTMPVGHRKTVYMFPQHLRRCFAEGDVLGLLRWIPFVSKTDIPWNEPWILLDAVCDLWKRAIRRISMKPKKPNPSRPPGKNEPEEQRAAA